MTNKKPRSRTKKILLGTFAGLTILGLGGTFAGQMYLHKEIQDVPKVTYSSLHSDSSSNMYASDGTLIWTSGTNRRMYVKIKDVPDTYKQLLLSTEDADFYKHEGFSVKGISNAVLSSVKAKLGMGEVRGGSTIEQQLIKLTVFSTSEKDRTLSRKIKELYLASQLYHNYSRDKILEFYINKINMGENSYGAQTIAHTYFGKKLDQLTLSQQAIIAGLGQAPSTYNLYDNPDGVRTRRNTVLGLAKERGVISKADYQKAINTPVTDGLKKRYWDSTKLNKVTADHNAFVNSTLAQVVNMGYDLQKTPLQIKTTLNTSDDAYLREVFNHHPEYFKNKKQQAACTVVDPKTGEVIAQIGGRYSTGMSDLNRATQTNRSSGSSIKPILDYGPAMEYFNWNTSHPLDGTPYTYPGTNVTARNFDGSTVSSTNLKQALRQSYNPPAIRTLNYVGQARAKSFMKGLGITTNQILQDSTALGLNVSTEQMASAMGAFGQDGVYKKQTYISSMKFPDNSVKYLRSKGNQAMRKSVAYAMTKVLEGVPSKQGTLPNSDLTKNKIYAGVKTGTVGYPTEVNIPGGEIAMDVWTVAYTKSFSLALWEGYDKPMAPGGYIDEMTSMNAKQALYKDLMKHFAKGRDTSEWVKPDTVAQSGSGLSANYSMLDNPPKHITKTLQNHNVKANQDYSDMKKYNSSNTVKSIKKPDNDNTVPKHDPNKNWRSELESEKDDFYSNN